MQKNNVFEQMLKLPIFRTNWSDVLKNGVRVLVVPPLLAVPQRSASEYVIVISIIIGF